MRIGRFDISPIASGLVACLSLVVIALGVVAIVHGITLSGDLTYGDLLVGLGTFALAVLTAVLADATFGVEKRAAGREASRDRQRLRGIGTLAVAEIVTINRTLTKIVTDKQLFVQAALPTTAWDQYATEILASLSDEDSATLVACFSGVHE